MITTQVDMLKTFSVYRANYAALELVDALRNTAPESPFETTLYKIVGNFHPNENPLGYI